MPEPRGTRAPDLGWPRAWITDLGGPATAREPEAVVLRMVRELMSALGTIPFDPTVVR